MLTVVEAHSILGLQRARATVRIATKDNWGEIALWQIWHRRLVGNPG